jgi:hypothetical protein
MAKISLPRIYILRASYLLIVVGLAFSQWPFIVSHPDNTGHMRGVVAAMLGGVAVLAALGIRYPLKMIPVLIFELIWKIIWLFAFALPLWESGEMDPAIRESVMECLFGVILVPLVLPWKYVWNEYLKAVGDRWK